jgi:hypothetical protein
LGCDRGISTEVYWLLWHQGDFREILPLPFHIKLAKEQQNQELLHLDPIFTLDGVELNPARVMAWLLELWPNVSTWVLAWDRHKLAKGMLASGSSMTGVYLIPKGKEMKQSRDQVYRLAMFEGPDNRFYLRRNTTRIQEWVKRTYEEATVKGKCGFSLVKDENRVEKYITLYVC